MFSLNLAVILFAPSVPLEKDPAMAQNRLYFSGLMEPEGPLRELASARMPGRATEVECGCHF
jgi:hypothetical protein